jgi:hypothetical protein
VRTIVPPPPAYPVALSRRPQILRQRVGVLAGDAIEEVGEVAGHKALLIDRRHVDVAVALRRLRPPEQPFLGQAHTDGHGRRRGDVAWHSDLGVDRAPWPQTRAATFRAPRWRCWGAAIIWPLVHHYYTSAESFRARIDARLGIDESRGDLSFNHGF